MLGNLALARFALLRALRLRPPVAVDAVLHQRMAGIEHLFDFGHAVALLAFHHVAAREHQIVENRVRLRELTKQVIALEKRVVPVAGMRNHQRLHHEGVFLHQISDAGTGIDHDLVGEPLITLAVRLFVADESLAE